MQKQTWIQTDTDEGSLIGTLNDLDDRGYMPWKLLRMEVEDTLDAINKRKVIRVLAHLKPQKK